MPKMIGINDKCIGCGIHESEPECKCEWATCKCGAWDCYMDENGDFSCRHCGYESDPKAYF